MLGAVSAVVGSSPGLFLRNGEKRSLGLATTGKTRLAVNHKMPKAMSPKVFIQIRDKARRGETSVEKVRPATANERELHRQSNPSGWPLQFVSEKIGDLAGLGFLNAYPTAILTSLKDKLFELGALDGKALTAGPQKAWVDWAGSIQLTFDGFESNLTDALLFFRNRIFNFLPPWVRIRKSRTAW